MLLLPEDTNSVLICVATGTGIAPYRSFWRRCFYENVPNYKFTGLFWLFMGVANSDAKLYDDEIQEMIATYPDQFRVDYALSREDQNKNGGKMYIQNKMEEYSDEIFDLLDNGAHIYFCGLKGAFSAACLFMSNLFLCFLLCASVCWTEGLPACRAARGHACACCMAAGRIHAMLQQIESRWRLHMSVVHPNNH